MNELLQMQPVPSIALQSKSATRHQKITEAVTPLNPEKFLRDTEDLDKEDVNLAILSALNKEVLMGIYDSLPSKSNQSTLAELIKNSCPVKFEIKDILETAEKLIIENKINSREIFAFRAVKLIDDEFVPAELKQLNIKNKLLINVDNFVHDLRKVEWGKYEFILDVALDMYEDNEMRLRYIKHIIDKIDSIKKVANDGIGKGMQKRKGMNPNEVAEIKIQEKNALGAFLENEVIVLLKRAEECYDPKFCEDEEAFFKFLEEKEKEASGNQKQFYAELKRVFLEKGQRIRMVEASLSGQFKVNEEFKGLRKHQLSGVDFLVNNSEKGGVLADEMGLGKTLTGIGAALYSKAKTNFIVCPNSLVENWRNELSRTNIPAENIVIINDLGDLVDQRQIDEAGQEKNGESPIFIILNNEKLSRKGYAEILSKKVNSIQDAKSLILDEAHNFKATENISKMVKTLFSLEVDKKFLLSGTPVVNDGNDLFNYLSLIDPERYPNDPESRRAFGKRVKKKDSIYGIYQELKQYMLKRNIADYDPQIKEIKAKAQRSETKVELRGYARKTYAKIIQSFRAKYQAAQEGKCVMTKIDYSKTLHLLKKLETDPNLAVDDGDGNTIFNYLTKHELEEVFGTSATKEVVKIVSNDVLPQKFEECIRLIEATPADDKAVVYVSSPETARRMADLLSERNINNCYISGQVKDTKAKKNRSERIVAFNDLSSGIKVLIMNQVGGEGINLFNARHLYKLDHAWTSAQDAQIDARIIRIGQTNDVTINSFTTKLPSEIRGDKKGLRAIDSYTREVILPVKEKLIRFLLEGMITESELGKLNDIVDLEKHIMIKLAKS